jgi:hypothetical protein
LPIWLFPGCEVNQRRFERNLDVFVFMPTQKMFQCGPRRFSKELVVSSELSHEPHGSDLLSDTNTPLRVVGAAMHLCDELDVLIRGLNLPLNLEAAKRDQ